MSGPLQKKKQKKIPISSNDGLHATQDPGGAVQNMLKQEEEELPLLDLPIVSHTLGSMSEPLQTSVRPISSNDTYLSSMSGPLQAWPTVGCQNLEGPLGNVVDSLLHPWNDTSSSMSGPSWIDPIDTRSSSDTLHTWAGLDTTEPDAIRNILYQEEPWTNVSDLGWYFAQDVVNFLQSELDNDINTEDIEYLTVCAKCLHALSFAYAVLPSNLYLPRTDLIQRDYWNPRSGRNNYEHCRVMIRGPRLVCLTRFRPSHGSDKDDKGVMLAALTWHQLRHDNILPLYGFSTEIFPETFCFVSPWMWRGNALDYLRVNPGHDRRGWARDIAAAMQYLHNLNPCVIHGAIKAENILIRDDLRCYLSGFWERQLDLSHVEGGNFMTNERANDVYSFGLTIIELYTGQRKVVDSAPEIPAHLWYKVILPCLDEVSDRRPSANTIINAIYKHHRAYFVDYLAGNHAPKGDHSVADFLLIASNGIPLWIAAAYIPPKLHVAISILLQEILKQSEPWKDVESWARNYGLDMQLVMDELQMELDQVTAKNSEHRRKCVKYLHELSRQYDILPSQLYIPEASFDPLDNILVGGGGFLDVHKASIMGRSVCMKSLKVHQTGPYALERMKKILRHEALIWRQTTYANILPFYGVSVDIIPSSLCFVSPWMAHGNIRQYLNTHPTHDPFGWVLNVAAAMQYLHSLDPCIIHKDIRGVNILVGDDLRAYLSDFGISLIVETHMLGTSSRGAGNVRWLPPELISMPEGSRNVLKEWDIYAFGCTVLEMYTHQDPYSELRSDGAVIYHLSQKKPPQQPLPDILPTSLWEQVVAPCLSSEPSDRPSAEAILRILQSNLH